MAWIELHQTLPKHAKLLRLKGLLNVRTAQALGHLCLLWLWAIDNAPDGDLSRCTARELAEVCEYGGRPREKLLAALQEAGFVDENMQLHNWADYTGRLTDLREAKRLEDRYRQRRHREKLMEEAMKEA